MQFWVGGYGPDHGGAAGEGIGILTAGDADDALAGGQLAFRGTAAAAPSPSWLAAHPTLEVLYATLEERGEVQAFRRTDETRFEGLGDPVVGGSALCHVGVAPDGGSLITASWGEGRLTRVPLRADGSLETTDAGFSVGRPPAGEMSLSSTGMSICAPARTTTLSSTAIGAISGAGGRRYTVASPLTRAPSSSVPSLTV